MADIIDLCEYKNEKAIQQKVNQLRNALMLGQYQIKKKSELVNLAEDIRQIGNYTGELDVPIIHIAIILGIKVYSANLEMGEIGILFAGGTTKELYGANEVILVSNNIPISYQRLVVAHELAHVLFDYIADNKFADGKLFFEEKYHENAYGLPVELRADFFASELLMPQKLFIRQYLDFMEQSKDRIVTIMCLADYFNVTEGAVEKRIKEILN